MLTIKITKERAIVVNSNSYALAKWTKKKDKEKGDYYTWVEYLWPKTLDRAVELLAQDMMSDMDETVSMAEFRLYFNGAIAKIKKLIDEAGA